MKGLSIPLNQKGAEEFDHGVLESENLIYIDFPDEEVDRLFDDNVVEDINNAFDLAIDDYESRQISKEKIKGVMNMVSENKYPVFYKALTIANKQGLFLSVDL